MTKPDQFGQQHPIETPEIIETKLRELHEQLEHKIKPEKKKKVYEQAKMKCPELVTDQDLLLFLRCEAFRVNVSKILMTLSHVALTTVHVTAPRIHFNVSHYFSSARQRIPPNALPSTGINGWKFLDPKRHSYP